MLHAIAWLALAAGFLSCLWLCLQVRRHPEPMAVMNWVWPLVALPGGPLTVWLYRRHRRPGPRPDWLGTAIATCHCGAGCTLGDLLAECLAVAAPGILVWFGWHSLFADRIFAGWVLDFLLAYLLGIAFQYFSIAPMRGLGLGAGLLAALKADTLSLIAWQVGMYGVMALVQFALMPELGMARLRPDRAEFWFAMQVAMLAGFAVSYPVNRWLLKTGLKEKM